jgi:hypothetical protein
MSKVILIFLILICAECSVALGQNLDESNKTLRALNHISKMMIYNMSLDEQDSTLSHELFFNEFGKTIRENRYNDIGELLISHVYHYDSTGFMFKYQSFDGNNDLRGEKVYNESSSKQPVVDLPTELKEIDSLGNTIAIYHVKDDIKTLKTTFKYDTSNRIIEHEVYITGKYYVPNSSNYDDKQEDQKTTILRKYARDSEGNIIEERIIRNEILTDIIHFTNIKRHP